MSLRPPTSRVGWVLNAAHPQLFIYRGFCLSGRTNRGLLELDADGVRMVAPARWQEAEGLRLVESAIARTLTAAIYAADTRVVTNSLNRLLRTKQLASARHMARSLDRLARM